MVDFLRRLYWKYYDDKSRNTKLAFCGINFPEGTFGDITDYCRELFSIIGISGSDLIDIRVPTKFRNVILPDVGYEYAKDIYSEFLIPYELIAGNIQLEGLNSKLYLSRTKFSGRKEAGEKAIEKLFGENGFTIVYPETMSVKEQIVLFANASVIASVEGTIAHNCLFMNKGTKQIIIKKQDEINPRQYLFDEAKKIETQYIDCYKCPIKAFPIDHDTGPFLLTYNTSLISFVNDNNLIQLDHYHLWNLYAYLQYFRICIKCIVKKWYRNLRRLVSVTT